MVQPALDNLPRPLYVDHAATTPLTPAAAAAMSAGQALVGNPSSNHEAGRAAAAALHSARRGIAQLAGVEVDELALTSGGSEANALALWGTFAACGFSGHLVTTSIEHASILENAYALSDLGVAVTLIDPGPTGHVAAADVISAIRPDTVLVSVMHANNETGAIQPVTAIAASARERNVPFHMDAVHTAGKLDITQVGATLISFSAHKFGGPRGIGALAVRRGHRLASMIRGGSQEHGLRAGTENVAGAMGMAAAIEASQDRLAQKYREAAQSRRDHLLRGLAAIGGVHCNVSEPVVTETVSVRLDGVRADTLADALDMHGIYASTGSACHAGQDSASHVLTAQGLTDQQARSTLRFSLGSDVSPADIDRIITTTSTMVQRLRKIAGTNYPVEEAIR